MTLVLQAIKELVRTSKHMLELLNIDEDFKLNLNNSGVLNRGRQTADSSTHMLADRRLIHQHACLQASSKGFP